MAEGEARSEAQLNRDEHDVSRFGSDRPFVF